MKVSVVVPPPSWIYVKLPFDKSVNVPFIGPRTSTAVMGLLSGSLSLDRTELVEPSLSTLTVPPVGTEIKSSTPVGASFVCEILTVIKSSTVQLISPSETTKLMYVDPF